MDEKNNVVCLYVFVHVYTSCFHMFVVFFFHHLMLVILALETGRQFRLRRYKERKGRIEFSLDTIGRTNTKQGEKNDVNVRR
jgi:hypothetical protein